jgi:crotonobetainyl-CoA:carnitine CoA-transferase CaiB-like acyl-CoA transferase
MGMFDGVRVIELAEWVFVPASGAVLSDFGADVIKIEHPARGDRYRGLHTAALGEQGEMVSYPVQHANRGKRSIGLDIKTPAGRELVLKLVDGADVFLTSMRPGALERAGLDPDTVRARNPRIIYARGSGFGQRGPAAERPGYDGTAFWARGGLGQTLSTDDQPHPVRQRPAMGDNPAAMNLAFGMAAALFHRERTGEGCIVDVSLMSTASWMLALDVLSAFNPGYTPTNGGRVPIWNPLVEPYRTKDNRWIAFVLLEPDRYWPELCRHLGRPDLVDDPRFCDAAVRKDNAHECVRVLGEVFATRTYAEWIEILKTFDAPWEPMQTAAELQTDEQILANGYLQPVQDAGFRLLTPPAQFDETPPVLTRAPEHGEHTEAVLLEIGVGWDEIAQLKDAGVVL